MNQQGWENVDSCFPLFTICLVGLTEAPDVNICVRTEGRAFIGDAYPGTVGVN